MRGTTSFGLFWQRAIIDYPKNMKSKPSEAATLPFTWTLPSALVKIEGNAVPPC
jgi:hypothetical protein